ncbi:hypothetical protein AAFN85_29735 [Mucilaginibacter sp. CAU 1740]|uniref:hypothetical protein n=1 Tax=Mucilaginibacter sp. CAU 1740 TaxID=3140365 RepID=UPI00325A7FAF
MKNYFLIAILCLIFSCKSNTKQASTDTLAASNTHEKSNPLIEKFKPLLEGTWVKKAYIDKVIATKSPLAAVDEAEDMTAFTVNTNDIKEDSIKVLVGWGNHDSSEMTLKFQAGKHPSSVIFGAGELSLTSEDGATILTYYHPDEKSKKIIATKFVKAPSSGQTNQLAYDTYYLVNKGLIAGDYIITDSLGKTSKINFEAHGKVTGFFNFNTYDINIDLNSDAMDNLDEISFKAGEKKYQSYSFKFDVDTLKLYETKPNEDSTLLVLDKMKYKLVKAK